MCEWTESEALRVHMETVAACMGHYAKLIAPDEEERWRVAGILHDFDYEKHPSTEEHPFVGVAHLESLGVDEAMRNAILGHATYSGVARDTPMARCLFACDELAGFIMACCKVRPNGIADLAPKSVKKKLKVATFAAGVNRDDIALGLEEFGGDIEIDLTSHVQHCIDGIRDAGFGVED